MIIWAVIRRLASALEIVISFFFDTSQFPYKQREMFTFECEYPTYH